MEKLTGGWPGSLSMRSDSAAAVTVVVVAAVVADAAQQQQDIASMAARTVAAAIGARRGVCWTGWGEELQSNNTCTRSGHWTVKA